MKINRLFNKGITGMLTLAGILCGCAEEDYEASQTVPLTISATCPAFEGNVATRATTTEVKIALNATAGGYASTAKTYQVTSTNPITFAPKDAANTWEMSNATTWTPLTIYGWLDENTPVAYSKSSIAVNNGNISEVTLSPLYACIGVRVLLGKDTESAGRYTISSSLKGVGTASANNGWNTSGTIPVLNAVSSSPGSIKNTNKTTVANIKAGDLTIDYFMRVAPTTIQASTPNLFTILYNGKQYPITSGNQAIKIENGNCYLFTVNIGSETSLQISSIEQMTIDEKITIVLHPEGVERKKGIYTRADWDKFMEGYLRNDKDAIWSWLNSNEVLNLYTDIDLNNEPWVQPFYGDFGFNGHGHTIYNLHVVSSGSEAGFYSTLSEPNTIEGLTIDGVTIDYDDQGMGDVVECGAIVGALRGGSVVDCHVKGKVTIRSRRFVGGVVGVGYYGNIYACTFAPDGTPTLSGQIAIGGIVGYLEGNPSVKGCIAHDFNFTDETAEFVGGISGMGNAQYCRGCVAYNIKTNKSESFGCIVPEKTDYEYCYYYNVFGSSSSQGEGKNRVAINKLEDLSNETVISDLNVPFYYSLPKIQFHYEASPTPATTGPTIKPGEVESIN